MLDVRISSLRQAQDRLRGAVFSNSHVSRRIFILRQHIRKSVNVPNKSVVLRELPSTSLTTFAQWVPPVGLDKNDGKGLYRQTLTVQFHFSITFEDEVNPRAIRAYPNNPLYPQGKPDACVVGEKMFSTWRKPLLASIFVLPPWPRTFRSAS